MNCGCEMGGGRGAAVRPRRVVRLLASSLLLSALCPLPSVSQQTRAERSNFTETSSYADVVAFLDSLEKVAGNRIVRGTIGTTVQGKALPYVIASRPLVRTPAQARASGKPVVYVQGNIHGGEIEGKEALQALLRDLVLEARPNALDSIILIAVPIYNADGNDAWGPQGRQRTEQNGPETVGLRPNSDTLDLNRDYIKNEAPETRASLMMFRTWDPDVFVDLHTTNGSYHGYALTYAPSLHPAAMVGALAPSGPWTRDTLLPEVRRRVRERRGFETYDYGNFSGPNGTRDDPTRTEKGGWLTYEHKPRFGTNYYGLRGRISVLTEAYSHDPFDRRVASQVAFVGELLSFLGEQGRTVVARTRQGSAALATGTSTPVPIRAAMTRSPFTAPVLVETLEATGDSVRHEPGLRPGFRRSGRIAAVTMPVSDRFDATMTQTLPEAWVLDSSMTAVVERLRLHGVEVRRLDRAWEGAGESFTVDSLVRAPRPFQKHNEVRLEGRWAAETLRLTAGSYVVPARQALALVAAIMLEPQSDDGLTTWNGFDAWLAVGRPHPVRRALAPVPAVRRSASSNR
jgi:hypothetical protein